MIKQHQFSPTCERCSGYDVVARVTLVEHGYQIDVYVDDKHVGSACRDFGGDYPIDELRPVVAVTLIEAMRQVEANAKLMRAASNSAE